MDAKPGWSDVREIKRLLDSAVLQDRDGSLWKDRNGSGVSTGVLKGVLNALLDHYPNMFPSISKIAARCGAKSRTVKRAIEVLQAKDILAVEHSRTNRGQTQSRYTLLYSKLRYLAQDERLEIFQKPGATTTTPGAIQAKPSATTTIPGATGGTLRPNEQEINQTSKRHVGEKLFSSEEERQEVLRLAYHQADTVGRPVGDQAEILIKISIWAIRGYLSMNDPDDIEECLRSVRKNKPDNKFAYYLSAIKERLSKNGNDYYDLLNSTDKHLAISK
jgi:hypothetical protein